jgi:hypothetical protein
MDLGLHCRNFSVPDGAEWIVETLVYAARTVAAIAE